MLCLVSEADFHTNRALEGVIGDTGYCRYFKNDTRYWPGKIDTLRTLVRLYRRYFGDNLTAIPAIPGF